MFGLIPCRPRKRQGNNPGSKLRNNVTIYRKPKSQRLKHPGNHKQTEPMKLINIARSILVIGYVMLVSCSSDEGGESGNGPQATGQELERQLLDTHWKLARETKVEDGTEKVLNNPYVLNTITFSGETDRAWHYLYLNNTHSGWWWIDGGNDPLPMGHGRPQDERSIQHGLRLRTQPHRKNDGLGTGNDSRLRHA